MFMFIKNAFFSAIRPRWNTYPLRAGNRKSIMLVTRPAIISLPMEIELVNLGFNVSGAMSNGKKAIFKCKKLKPDIVIMDIGLKGELDGFETAKIIKKRSHKAPVILMNHKYDEKIARRAKRINAAGLIYMPYTTKELTTSIKNALKLALPGQAGQVKSKKKPQISQVSQIKQIPSSCPERATNTSPGFAKLPWEKLNQQK